jgi:hypothetical protein
MFEDYDAIKNHSEEWFNVIVCKISQEVVIAGRNGLSYQMHGCIP